NSACSDMILSFAAGRPTILVLAHESFVADRLALTTSSAPEILDNSTSGHSFEVDIWSLGVIMYTILVGYPPFETSNIKETYARIRANNYEYPSRIPISAAAKDLISRMLVLLPNRRATLRQIRSHLFFMSNVPTSLPLSALKSNPFNSTTDANQYDQRCLRH
ncbi:hypothetical protein BVRB_022830, partial [Beta vulgaris subsp. vulgaris]